MLWIFSPEKSDGFGGVRTRDLTTGPPKPLSNGVSFAFSSSGVLPYHNAGHSLDFKGSCPSSSNGANFSFPRAVSFSRK
jgi:hypothetical protein